MIAHKQQFVVVFAANHGHYDWSNNPHQVCSYTTLQLYKRSETNYIFYTKKKQNELVEPYRPRRHPCISSEGAWKFTLIPLFCSAFQLSCFQETFSRVIYARFSTSF